MNRRGFLGALFGLAITSCAKFAQLPIVIDLTTPANDAALLSFSEIVSMTLRKHRHELVDNVMKNNQLLHRLLEKSRDGGIKLYSGEALSESVSYGDRS
jgi:hypothetical protein